MELTLHSPHRNRKKAGLKIAELDIGAELIRIHFPYDKLMLARIKTLYGRKFEREPQPHWTAPFSTQTVQQLQEWDFPLGPELKKRIAGMEIKHTAEDIAKTMVISGMKKELFPFQHEDVAFVESRNGRALLGHQMGLGKTAMALAYLQYHPELRPALIICPATLKQNWRREAETWMPGSIAHTISGRSTGQPLPSADLYIINYDIVAETEPIPCKSCKGKGNITWADEKKICPNCNGTGDSPKKQIKFRQDVQDAMPKAVVIDEIHYLKNRNAQRTKAVLTLRNKVDCRIGLSGTPIVNRPSEFFNALRFIAPERFTSFWRYAQQYCGAVHNGYGWDFSGATNTKELHDVLTSTIMRRRLKADVLKDLPAKVRAVISIPMTDSKKYDAEEANFKREYDYIFGEEITPKQNSGADVLVQIEKLKQKAVKEKLPSAIQWIRDYLETEDKLVVFTTHQFTVDRLIEELGEFNPVVIDGRTPMNHRQERVDKFQNDDNCRLFIGNVKAAGVGITLTASNATCFLELPWTPGEAEQAEDRVHRIGQEADSIMAYYLVAEGTIEEEIAALLDEKAKVLTAVLDGQDVEATSLLTELLRRMK